VAASAAAALEDGLARNGVRRRHLGERALDGAGRGHDLFPAASGEEQRSEDDEQYASHERRYYSTRRASFQNRSAAHEIAPYDTTSRGESLTRSETASATRVASTTA